MYMHLYSHKVFKADDKKIVSNHLPLSILPVLSKVIERLVYNQLIEFLTKHNILHSSQYGFRKNLSTTVALVDNLTTSIDNNEITIGIFVALAKAFDTVNHNIGYCCLNYTTTE